MEKKSAPSVLVVDEEPFDVVLLVYRLPDSADLRLLEKQARSDRP